MAALRTRGPETDRNPPRARGDQGRRELPPGGLFLGPRMVSAAGEATRPRPQASGARFSIVSRNDLAPGGPLEPVHVSELNLPVGELDGAQVEIQVHVM